MDRRVKYTKKVIKDNFVELLQTKDINKITVSELCEISDINRATFYRYYIDIYDLLEKIEEELIDELKEVLPNYKDYTMKDIVKEYLKIFIKNKEILKVVFNNSKNIFFLNDFLAYIYENCKERWFGKLEIDEEYKSLISIYEFNGILGVINYWVKNDFEESVDKIADLIDKVCYKGLYGYKK